MRKDPDVRDGLRAGRKHYGKLQEEVPETNCNGRPGAQKTCTSQLRNRVSAQSLPLTIMERSKAKETELKLYPPVTETLGRSSGAGPPEHWGRKGCLWAPGLWGLGEGRSTDAEICRAEAGVKG